MMMQFV